MSPAIWPYIAYIDDRQYDRLSRMKRQFPLPPGIAFVQIGLPSDPHIAACGIASTNLKRPPIWLSISSRPEIGRLAVKTIASHVRNYLLCHGRGFVPPHLARPTRMHPRGRSLKHPPARRQESTHCHNRDQQHYRWSDPDVERNLYSRYARHLSRKPRRCAYGTPLHHPRPSLTSRQPASKTATAATAIVAGMSPGFSVRLPKILAVRESCPPRLTSRNCTPTPPPILRLRPRFD